MKKILNLSFLIIFGLIPSIGFTQSAEEVIQKYIATSGGSEKIDAMNIYQYKKFYKVTGASEYSEEVTIITKEAKLSRKKSILDRDFYYILNNTSGWVKIPMGSRDKVPSYSIKELSEKEKSDLSLEVADVFFPLNNYNSKGYKLTNEAEDAEIDGSACSKVTIEKGGMKREYFIEKTSGLVKRENAISNGITHTFDYSNYAETKNGIKYPSVASYINTKDKKKTEVLIELTLDVPTQGVSFIK